MFDPIIEAPSLTQSYNRYSYVMNRPLSHIDPSGYSSCDSGTGRGCGQDPGAGNRKKQKESAWKRFQKLFKNFGKKFQKPKQSDFDTNGDGSLYKGEYVNYTDALRKYRNYKEHRNAGASKSDAAALSGYGVYGQQNQLTAQERLEYLSKFGVTPRTLQKLSGVVGGLTRTEFQYFLSDFYKGEAVDVLAKHAQSGVQQLMSSDATIVGFGDAVEDAAIEATQYLVTRGVKVPTNWEVFFVDSIPQVMEDIDVIEFYADQVQIEMGNGR